MSNLLNGGKPPFFNNKIMDRSRPKDENLKIFPLNLDKRDIDKIDKIFGNNQRSFQVRGWIKEGLRKVEEEIAGGC